MPRKNELFVDRLRFLFNLDPNISKLYDTLVSRGSFVYSFEAIIRIRYRVGCMEGEATLI